MIYQIVWSHGWGFNADFFTPLCQALPKFHHNILDWGYFGKPHIPTLDLHKPIIGIGHSLGLAKLLDLKLPFTALVSLAGFTHFCQSRAFQAGTPLRVLARMEEKFILNPQQVLADFYVSCGYKAFPFVAQPLNLQLLQQDLSQLRTLSIDLPKIPLLAIAGKSDRVCPLSQQQAQFDPITIIQGAHHFPQVNPVQTALLIQQFLKKNFLTEA